METDSLIRGLQGSIAPCVLISATGLLLLAMSNRLGRSTDRIRQLCSVIEKEKHKEDALKNQIAIFYKRCELLQVAIALVVLCIFCVSTVILMLFSMIIFNVALNSVIQLVFAAGLICLITALLFFLTDITLTLKSIRIEIETCFPKEKV